MWTEEAHRTRSDGSGAYCAPRQ